MSSTGPVARSGAMRVAEIAVIVALALLLMWVSIGVTATMTLGRKAPEVALKWWPWGAVPKAALAARIAADAKASSAELARAEGLAKAALAREPVNVEAARVLAVIRGRQNKLAAADRFFLYAEKLSRRDLPTQLWLIERSVRANDVPGALKHYDRALRTSRTAPDMLLPILVAASSDPAIVAPLAQTLVVRPLWWRQFMTLATGSIKDSRTLVTFARSLKLRMSNAEDAEFAIRIVGRLVQDGHYGTALGYYHDLKQGSEPRNALLRNGEFDRDESPLPFDWWLRNDPGAMAYREGFNGDQSRLVVRVSEGSGDVARQMIVLKPGSYVLSGRSGALSGKTGQLSASITCVGGASLLGSAIASGASDAGAKFEMPFVVPASGCAGQMLGIRAQSGGDIEVWLDGLTITAK